MKRPVPVVLTAVLLGLLGALQLFLTVSNVVVGFLVLHKGLPASPTPQPLPSSAATVMFFVMSLLAAASAVWSLLTLIGLVRLRSWARYSVLAIAGLMAGFGAISMVTSLAMPFLMPTLPAAANQPALDAGTMRGVFFLFGAMYGVAAAIGAALLVYFNLARTRALFLENAPVELGPPNTLTGRRRPTAVTAISWLYLVTGPCCAFYLFMPLPAFLFGFVFYGLAAHVFYLAMGVLTFAIGYGLLRLHNGARLTVFALFALCPIQLIVLATPWGRRQLNVYLDAVDAWSRHISGIQAATPNLLQSPGAMLLFSALGVAGYGVILWLLHRHRAAFTPVPPPPPLPLPLESVTP